MSIAEPTRHPPVTDEARPWLALPESRFPVELEEPANPGLLDDAFELPEASAATVAEVQPDGSLLAWRWRGTGELGFYPASSVKWITATMTLRWLVEHGLPVTGLVGIHADPDDAERQPAVEPMVVRTALLAMLTHSDNEAFNVLQEAVGFRETFEAMRAWGCRHAIIRRNFAPVRRSTSRSIDLYGPDGKTRTLAPRLDTRLPLSTDARPPPLGNPEANFATTDDLVRSAAASLMGPARRMPGFDAMTAGLACPEPRDVAAGLDDLAREDPDPAGFTVLSKPGWWPPDRANVELAYAHDTGQNRHFFACLFVQDEEQPARDTVRRAAGAMFSRLRRTPPNNA